MKKKVSVFWLFVCMVVPLYSQGQEYRLKKMIGVPLSSPYCITVDKDGNMYVPQEHTLFKINSKGDVVAQFGSLGSANGQFNSPRGVVIDTKGNIYVSDTDNHRIQKFDAQGKFVAAFGSLGSAQGQFNRPWNIAIDKQDNLYVMDTNNHRIQKFDAQGTFLTSFGSYGSADGQFSFPEGITVDSQGNIYVADTGTQRIQKFDAQGTFLISFSSRGSANDPYTSPSGVAVDAVGAIYVVDSWNQLIQKFDAQGKLLAKFGSYGSTEVSFTHPRGIFVDTQDNIYVVDSERIRRLSTQGRLLAKFGSLGSEDGQFYYPIGIAVDTKGNMYVADRDNHRIQKFDSEGTFLGKFGSQGSGNGQFEHPTSVATDLQDNIYVVDDLRIQKFDAQGKLVTKFGSNGSVQGGFYNSIGIVVDKKGTIYVVDSWNHRIRKFDAQGKFVATFGSKGFDDGQLSYPEGIAVDTQGNVYVADTWNNRIQKFDAQGKFVATFGSLGSAQGQFHYPRGIALDAQNNIYVADSYNRRIQKLDAKGTFVAETAMGLTHQAIALDSYNTLHTIVSHSIVIYDNAKQWNQISGYIFSDENQNCILEPGEKPLSDVLVVAQPGNYYSRSDQTGKYTIKVDTGIYTVSQVLKATGRLLEPICPATNISQPVSLKLLHNNVSNINFANQATLTPYLSIDVTSNRRRRCFLNTTTVSYSNTGYADAQNVKVYVKMPRYVVLKSADQSYVMDKDTNYIFTIGTLKVGETGKIQIKDSVVCQQGITGLTVCTKAWITPDNSINPKSTWDQSDITLTGKCIENGRVRLVIKNIGQGNMADSSEFRVFLDAKLALRKNFKLVKGDSLTLRIPANGKTVRLEVAQRPDHPRKSQSNLTLEGCAASATDSVSKGFVDMLPQDDAEPNISVDCQQIIDSFDPNDKQVSPIGTTMARFTPTTSELKYVIRFQNTGSDTAYIVTVIDTLSEYLDIATLRQGAASHPYTFTVSGKGHPVLIWKFSYINLPDSTQDQLGSNGFVQFSIKPKTGLAEKTRIENFADIIFDYNDPVRTNATFNVMYDVPAVVDNSVRLDGNTVIPSPPTISSFAPESVSEGMQVVLTGTNYESVSKYNLVQINGITATVVAASPTQLTVVVPQGVKPGKISITTDGGMATSQKNLLLRPIISGFSPASVLEGESLTITGKYYEPLTANNTIQINGITATILSATETQLVVRVPQGAKPGKINVTTPGGTVLSEQVLLFRPTISSFTPTNGQPGAEMTIAGTHYEPVAKNNVVKINGIYVAVLYASETQLVVTIPTGVTRGKVSVTTPGGTAVSEEDFVATPLATEPVWSRTIRIYPNPADDKLMIDFSATTVSVYRMEVVNMLGQLVVGQTLSKGTQMEELNLSSVGAGMYLLVLKTSEGTAIRKIQIK